MIADLPGVPMDEGVRGHTACDLLSTEALVRYAREKAPALGVPAEWLSDDHSVPVRVGLPRLVADRLESPCAEERAAAAAIGRRLGRNLGHILLVLHRGDAVNRLARAEWHDGDWDRWAAVRCVWLGGGLVTGLLGELVAREARHYLGETGQAGQITIEVSERPDAMGLLGASRFLPADTRQALSLDCGSTLVKRACVTLIGGCLVDVQSYQPLPVPWDLTGPDHFPGPGDMPARRALGRRVLAFVSEVIAQTLAESESDGHAQGSEVMLSVATYVRGGRLLGSGPYAQMGCLARDVRPLLAEATSQLTGRSLSIHPIHDGTAAAALHAGTPNAVVLVLGTALAVGFPPPLASHLRPLALIKRP
jgi:hypothetical protein